MKNKPNPIFFQISQDDFLYPYFAQIVRSVGDKEITRKEVCKMVCSCDLGTQDQNNLIKILRDYYQI